MYLLSVWQTWYWLLWMIWTTSGCHCFQNNILHQRTVAGEWDTELYLLKFHVHSEAYILYVKRTLSFFIHYALLWKLKVLFLLYSFGILLIKREMEINPSEFYSSLLCVSLHLKIFSNSFSGKVTGSLSFCYIIVRSSAKFAVIPIIIALDNSVLILRFFFKNSYEYFSTILNNHWLLQY